ncbi:hypothetical protein NCCP2050_16530 [Planococcus sp. NCCP-2050]|nr:hypothetical protein NCCP2050_16530 [Planococcus sp. NCCP-2050]
MSEMENSLNHALNLRREGKLFESHHILEEMISVDPENALLRYEYAWSCDILAKDDEAISSYKLALKLGLPEPQAVNAYGQIGSLYRLQGCLEEAEHILMSGMSKVQDDSLLKIHYAFTQYDFGDSEEAMRWMVEALLSSTRKPEILLNQRAISYLGSNLNAPDIIGILKGPFGDEIKASEKEKSLIEKVEGVLKVFEPTYFHGAWTFEFHRYDLHFADSDDQTQRAAFAAFSMMAGIWETGSATSFMPQHERKYTGGFRPDKPYFELNGYIAAFYSNYTALEQEFPVMTVYAVAALSAIDGRSKLGLEQDFPEMDPTLFQQFRKDILMPYRQVKKKLPPFEDFLNEIG